MKFDGTISKGGDAPPCIGLIPSVLPEVQDNNVAKNSQTGASTKTLYRKHLLRVVKEVTKTFLIGMHFVLRMAGKRKHTIIW